MQDRSAFVPLNNFINDNHCYACGSRNPFGLHMRLSTNGQAVASEVVLPGHMCGWGNLIHGGIVSTLLDETMSWAAMHLLKRLVLTRTMEIEFLAPVAPDTPLRTEGWVDQVVKNTEAIIKAALSDASGQLCARATGKFALLSPKMMRRLKILDEGTIAGFERKYAAP